MKIKMIEFEATGEELKTNRTLLEAISDVMAGIIDGIGHTTLPLQKDDEEENADEDDA